MNPRSPDQAVRRAQEEAQARKDEVTNYIKETFATIFEKGHSLNYDDKAFLQARQSYLSKAEREEYGLELAEDLNGTGTSEEETRAELEQRAIVAGVPHPEKLKNKKEILQAIEDAEKLKKE